MQLREFVRLSYWTSLLQINTLLSVLGLVAYIFRFRFLSACYFFILIYLVKLSLLFFSFFLYKEKIDKNNEKC